MAIESPRPKSVGDKRPHDRRLTAVRQVVDRNSRRYGAELACVTTFVYKKSVCDWCCSRGRSLYLKLNWVDRVAKVEPVPISPVLWM